MYWQQMKHIWAVIDNKNYSAFGPNDQTNQLLIVHKVHLLIDNFTLFASVYAIPISVTVMDASRTAGWRINCIVDSR